MILSQACQYGLRAVLFLALDNSEPVLSKEIAAKLQIPPHFLAKILQDLSRRGLLLSFKGRGGGFRLARPADQIRLQDIVLAIEGEGFGKKCVLGLAECNEEIPCPVHSQWAPIKQEIWRMLGEKSIQQLVRDAAQTRRFLLPDVPIDPQQTGEEP